MHLCFWAILARLSPGFTSYTIVFAAGIDATERGAEAPVSAARLDAPDAEVAVDAAGMRVAVRGWVVRGAGAGADVEVLFTGVAVGVEV